MYNIVMIYYYTMAHKTIIIFLRYRSTTTVCNTRKPNGSN